jgi:uncharacterized protein
LNQGLFWKIYHPDHQDDHSVIFGTIHINISDQNLINRITSSIDRYGVVYTETSLAKSDSNYLFNYIKLEKPYMYGDYFNIDQFQKLRKIIMKAANIDLEDYKMFRPIFILGLIYSQLMDRVVSDSQKLDDLIWSYAQEQGKSCRGLETIEEQVRIMTQIPYSYDFSQLKKMGRNISSIKRQLNQLIKLYLNEDLRGLYKQSSRSIGNLRPLLLYNRNEIMAQRIFDIHSEERCFFSFGAGHLTGNKGVLNLLKQKGMKVKKFEIRS